MPHIPPYFDVKLPMFWGDMDALAHLNNVQYFRYCEQARTEWLKVIGFNLKPRPDFSLVLVTTSCTFLKPIEYPADVTIRIHYDGHGRTSFSQRYEFYVNDDFDTIYAEAKSKVVCINPSENKSTPIPEFLLNYLTQAESSNNE